MKNYKQGTEITAVGEFERKGKVLNINYCILGDWDTYYAFDNTFQIDVDLEDLIESAKKNDKSIDLKKENITLVKDENNNIVSGRIYGNSIKFKTPINVKLDQKSLSILTNRMESTKIEFLFVNELNHPYSILYFQEYFYKAFEQLYPDKKVCKHMYSIRAGNLKFLESHNVKYFEIKFRQRMNTHDPVHFYMEDQSASINAINKYLK